MEDNLQNTTSNNDAEGQDTGRALRDSPRSADRPGKKAPLQISLSGSSYSYQASRDSSEARAEEVELHFAPAVGDLPGQGPRGGEDDTDRHGKSKKRKAHKKKKKDKDRKRQKSPKKSKKNKDKGKDSDDKDKAKDATKEKGKEREK